VKARDIPNLLCVFRILLTLPVAWAILEGRYPIALGLFLLAGFTDLLDGFLAKRFSWQSRLGGMLDPIADKLLLATSFVTLWLAGYVPGWLLAAVVARDLVIVGGAGLYRWLIGPFDAEPSVLSKLNSFLQLLYVVLTLSLLVFSLPGPGLIAALGWIVFATTVISGAHYVIRWGGRARAARA
jgi:cardiolipin synthase (CMP-forming)